LGLGNLPVGILIHDGNGSDGHGGSGGPGGLSASPEMRVIAFAKSVSGYYSRNTLLIKAVFI